MREGKEEREIVCNRTKKGQKERVKEYERVRKKRERVKKNRERERDWIRMIEQNRMRQLKRRESEVGECERLLESEIE